MIQIWFGLIMVNPMDQNIIIKKIKKKHKETQNTVIPAVSVLLFRDMGSDK